MKNNVYGVVRREQSRKGKQSLILAGISTVIFALIVFLACKDSASLPAVWGAAAIIAAIIAIYGISNAIGSRHERNKSRTAAIIGLIWNSLLVLAFVYVFILGVR